MPLASGQSRNIDVEATSDGRPGAVYVDNSGGTAAAATLKYAFRNGLTASTAWTRIVIPNVSTPMAPAIAFDHNDLPWISYYDGALFRFFLMTNTATDGSGEWSQYQFPINAKTATATAPAMDATAVAMWWSGGTARPVMIVMNSTAAGGQGVRASLFQPSSGTFSAVQTVDTLGAAFGTRLDADWDRSGNIVLAWYDVTATRVEFSSSSNATTWLGTSAQISSPNTGREGLSVKISPATGRPSVAWYDRAGNGVAINRCTTDLAQCGSAGNWASATVASAVGSSSVPVANEQLLSTSLSFSADGDPYVAYMTGNTATQQILGVADNLGGSWATTTLRHRPASGVAGAAGVNFDMVGFNVSSVRTGTGELVTTYIGPGNWLQATSCSP